MTGDAAAAEPKAETVTTQPVAKGVLTRRDRLTRDLEVQARERLDEPTVAEYAELMRGDIKFPALVAFDDGERLWLADGFHRDAAAGRAGLTSVPCDIRKGSRRDAVLFSIWANARHGLLFTNADKRRAVARLLRDEVCGRWGDREIARQAAVSKSFVGAMRRELQPAAADSSRLTRRGG
jgi:hypothetical protein